MLEKEGSFVLLGRYISEKVGVGIPDYYEWFIQDTETLPTSKAWFRLNVGFELVRISFANVWSVNVFVRIVVSLMNF